MIKKFKDYLKEFQTNKNGGFQPDVTTNPVTPETPGKPADVAPETGAAVAETPKKSAPVMPEVAPVIDMSIVDGQDKRDDEKKDKGEKPAENSKEISGFKEVIEVEGLGKMKAKFDTGNTAYCAIIVQDFKEKDGKVTFEFDGEDRTYDIVKHVKIYHHGKATERPVIKVNLKFNGKVYKDEEVDLKISDLSGTKHYRSRMLICKKFMEKANIMIDPSKDFKLTNKDELPKKKKTVKKTDKKDEK